MANQGESLSAVLGNATIVAGGETDARSFSSLDLQLSTSSTMYRHALIGLVVGLVLSLIGHTAIAQSNSGADDDEHVNTESGGGTTVTQRKSVYSLFA